VQVEWHDWLTESVFRIRVSPVAAERLSALPESTQVRLRHMINEIAELADCEPVHSARSWNASPDRPLLQLHIGRLVIRYSIDHGARTLSIDHVIVPVEPDEPEESLQEKLSKVG
jgi:hypothetical protein